MKTWLGSNVGDNNIDTFKKKKKLFNEYLQWNQYLDNQGKNEFL